MREHEAKERVGTVLRGKWRLERLLGVGGMGAVYEAVHRIGRRDAIKILHPEFAASAEVRARFEREAHAANRVEHPGAVEIRDVDVAEDGSPFLVMELLEGEPLSALAARPGGLTVEKLLDHVDALLDVLAEAHARGILHRDVKPDNVFVLPDGRVKVLDFGVARLIEDEPGAARTKTGAMLGTVSYMAPEQVRGDRVDARVDVFAVGATMFRLLSRRRIHEARGEADMLVKMATEPAPSLASVAPSVPRGVAAVVDRALAFDRNARFGGAREMQAAVRAARAELAGRSPRAGLPAPAAPAAPAALRAEGTTFGVRERRTNRKLVAAAGLLLVAGLCATLSWRLATTPEAFPSADPAALAEPAPSAEPALPAPLPAEASPAPEPPAEELAEELAAPSDPSSAADEQGAGGAAAEPAPRRGRPFIWVVRRPR